ncbi:MAG: T9SS type A sorting domain-containing protein [Bacteroidota bacterium]
MKKLLIVTILLHVVCLMSSVNTEAQYFVAASVSGTALTCAGTGFSAPVNIECDDFVTLAVSNSNEMFAMVRDKGTSSSEKYGWDDNGSYSGVRNLNKNNAQLIDVALVASTVPKLYAVIVYYSPGSTSINYEVWLWNDAGHTFTNPGSSTVLVSSITPTAVHIDANFYGEFAVTWDDASNNIFIETGTTGGGTPTFSGSVVNVSTSLSTTTYGMFPDVAIHNDTHRSYGGGAFDNVYVTWMDVNSTYIYEAENPRATIQSGSWINTGAFNNPLYQAGGGHTVYPSRIAAASDYDQGASSWDINKDVTVVFEDSKGSTFYDIMGFSGPSQFLYLSTMNIFTDGSMPYLPGSIDNYPNYSPAVSYDQVNGSAIVAWISDYYGDNYFNPSAPCALELDATTAGYPLVATCSYYMTVPYSNLNTSAQLPVALSGKHGKADPFYCWYDNTATLNFTTYKSVPAGSSNLRKASPLSVTSANVYPNPFADKINVRVSNINAKSTDYVLVTIADNFGHILFRQQICFATINEAANNAASKLSAGAYDFQIIDSQGNNLIHQQIIKASR